MGKDTRKMNNIMRAEVRKCIEFSLPQAQVFYISSRNKFIVVKTTAPQLFRSPPDPAWQQKQLHRAQISTWRLDMSRRAANHGEEHFDDYSDDKIQ